MRRNQQENGEEARKTLHRCLNKKENQEIIGSQKLSEEIVSGKEWLCQLMFLDLIRKIQIENCSLNETILRWQLPHYHQKSECEGPRAVYISGTLPWPFIPHKPHKLTSVSCFILSSLLSHSHQLLQRRFQNPQTPYPQYHSEHFHFPPLSSV